MTTQTKRFYYFTPTKYALENLENRRLKAAELDKANDPFEFLPVRCRNEEETHVFETLKGGVSQDMKMICLSETYKNPSLWGHYADNCRGIALGFDIEVHEEARNRVISEIKYINEKLDISEFGFYYNDGALKSTGKKAGKIRHYKSWHWKHEKEWRIWEAEDKLELNPVTGLYYFPIGDLLTLREILIGFRCKEENIERRFEKLSSMYPAPVKIIRTCLSPSTFEVERIDNVT